MRNDYLGRDNEIKFIKYLEQKEKSLEWWFKNGEGSKEYFCLKYFNTSKKVDALFYPDWILKFKDGKVGLFDTKSGFTAINTEGRAEGLSARILQLNKEGGSFIGGIVVLENEQWYYNHSTKYKYSPGNINSDWQKLDEIL